MVPWAIGLFFLVWGLDRAILAGDELHLIRALGDAGAWDLLTSFRRQDHCRPLAGLFALLLTWNIPLNGWILRLPSLVAYACLLLLGPLWLYRTAGSRSASALAWLMATSPLAILYGRIVRPYAAVLFLVPASLLLFLAWERQRRPALLGGHVLLGTLAAFFHPVVTPMVLAPALYALHRAACRRSWRALTDVLIAPILTGLGVFFSLIPAWSSFRSLASSKMAAPSPGLIAHGDALKALSGTPSGLLAVVLISLMALGARDLAIRHRRLASIVAWSSAAQLAGIWVLRPLGFENGIQYARYLIGILPWLVLCMAIGWSRATRTWSKSAACGTGLVGLALIVSTGPLVKEPFFLGSFAHHKDVLGFYLPPARLTSELPAGYRWLLERRGQEPIIEAPGPMAWRRNRVFYVYQSHHRRPVRLAVVGLAPPPLVRVPGVIPAYAIEELATAGRYLMLHHDLGAEDGSLEVEFRSPASALAVRPAEDATMKLWGEELYELYRDSFGSPVFTDGQVSIWDLRSTSRTPDTGAS